MRIRSKPKLLIYGNDTSGFRWRLRAPNGRIVASSSEAFSRRRVARRNAVLTRYYLSATIGATK